jgi:AcrR family transcriptional regulator
VDESDSRRERKKQETRQRLLESAWDLFGDKGYDQTTVAEITERADVAKGTFFNYFSTKEEIVDQIALWRIDLLGNRVLGEGNTPDGALGRIKVLLRAMASELAPKQSLTRHLFLARIGAPIRHESAHRIGSLVQELVVQGQASGEIRDDVEPGFVARLLMTGWFYYFVRRCHEDGSFPEEERVIESVDVLMSGLRGAKGRST